MNEYIDFHSRNLFVQTVIRVVINFSNKLNHRLFCLFWNTLLFLIRNSVRISINDKDSFLIQDSSSQLIIGYKKRFEYYMQSINHRYDQLIDEYMLSEIEFENDDIVIDCGANIGEIYNALKHNNSKEYSFSYYAFEPSKYEFSILNQNSKNLVEKPYALYSENTLKTFYLNGELADSSLEKSKESLDSIEVECIRLDSYFDNNENIKLLKLEAEGSELDVLHGAKKILKNINYITADLGFELESNTKNNLIEVNELLINNGFELIRSHKRWVFLYKNIKLTNR